MATASLVLGIISLLSMFLLPLLGPLFGFIGLILGVKGKKQLESQNLPSGTALAGIITSSIGFVFSTLLTLLLIAVAVPKFTEAINKARASEASVTLRHIVSSEEVWMAENGEYISLSSDEELLSVLGVNTESEYFTYSVEATTDSTFIAYATLVQQIGKAKVGANIWINNDGEKGASGDEIQKLLPTWYTWNY